MKDTKDTPSNRQQEGILGTGSDEYISRLADKPYELMVDPDTGEPKKIIEVPADIEQCGYCDSYYSVSAHTYLRNQKKKNMIEKIGKSWWDTWS